MRAASSVPLVMPAAANPSETAEPTSVKRPPTASRAIPAARVVAAADAVLITCALLFARANQFASWPHTFGQVMSQTISVARILQLVAFAAIAVAVFRGAGLYDAANIRHRGAELVRIVFATAVIAAAVTFSGALRSFDLRAVVTFWMAGVSGIMTARAVRARITRSPSRCRRALIVGSGPQALRVCRELSSHPATPYRVLGFVDTVNEGADARSRFVARRTFGTLGDLERILVHEHIDEVHVGLPIRSHYLEIQETIRVCERVGVNVVYRADMFNTVLARPAVESTSPHVALHVATQGAPVAIKRAIDVILAATLLVSLSPLMLATAVLITMTSKGPVIFSQVRYGLNRRRFRMLKFRTMVDNADRLQELLEARNEARGPVFKIARDPRVTPLGRFLRRASIDELPQLVNVLRGEMSLVGPRPLPLRDVARFARASDMRRFSVRPGLTGLTQVSGRSNLDFDDWIRLDLDYIDRWSLRLDFSVLARTFPAVIRGTGAA